MSHAAPVRSASLWRTGLSYLPMAEWQAANAATKTNLPNWLDRRTAPAADYVGQPPLNPKSDCPQVER